MEERDDDIDALRVSGSVSCDTFSGVKVGNIVKEEVFFMVNDSLVLQYDFKL